LTAHLQIYNKIREPLNIKQNVPLRNVYLKRDGVPNNIFGNSETGILRQIFNEDMLIERLKSLGFEIIVLGNKNILEKTNIVLQNYYAKIQIINLRNEELKKKNEDLKKQNEDLKKIWQTGIQNLFSFVDSIMITKVFPGVSSINLNRRVNKNHWDLLMDTPFNQHVLLLGL
jgi:hypothetical protein